MRKTKEKKGITLISLVITIVILLILVGVTINISVDEGGLFLKTNEAAVAQDKKIILEKLTLEYVLLLNEDVEFLGFIEDSGWTDSNADNKAALNVPNLVGKTLKTGNGSDSKDVYTVEVEDSKYKLMYYDEEGTKIEIGVIGNKKAENSGPALDYTQADIDATLEYFTFDEATGILTPNTAKVTDYYNKPYPETAVIPAKINGVTVTAIANVPSAGVGARGAFSNSKNLKKVILLADITAMPEYMFDSCPNLESIVIPSSVTSIGRAAFNACAALSEIIIPSNVTTMGDLVFYNCTSLTNIYCEAASQPSGWNSNWKGSNCTATVQWGYTPTT